MATLYTWLSSSWLAHFMYATRWTWPWAEALHFIGMALLYGSIFVMDIRLLGFFRDRISLHAVHGLTPWGFAGFLINLVTGIGFFSTDPPTYANNVMFLFKIGCIFLAGINFLVFWFVIRKQLESVPEYGDASGFGKFVGLSSIVLWTLVIWAGRMLPVYGMG
ncbi:MAG: hypothetical protein AB7I12_09955 [Steroidobacteraceae bacterium]